MEYRDSQSRKASEFQLAPKAPDLDLVVGAPEIFHLTIGQHAPQVAGVEDVRIAAVRIGLKYRQSLLGPPPVAYRDVAAAINDFFAPKLMPAA